MAVKGPYQHQNLLSNNNDAQSITKYGCLVRPYTQVVALRTHCASAPPPPPTAGQRGCFSGQQRQQTEQKKQKLQTWLGSAGPVTLVCLTADITGHKGLLVSSHPPLGTWILLQTTTHTPAHGPPRQPHARLIICIKTLSNHGGGGFWQEAMVLCSRLQLAAPTGRSPFTALPFPFLQ